MFPHTTNKYDTHAQCPYVSHAVSQEVVYKVNMAPRTRFIFSVWCMLMLSSTGVPKSSEFVSCRSTWPLIVLTIRALLLTMACGASRFASCQAALEGRNEMPGSRIATFENSALPASWEADGSSTGQWIPTLRELETSLLCAQGRELSQINPVWFMKGERLCKHVVMNRIYFGIRGPKI